MFDGDTPIDKTTDKRLVKDRERSRRFLESSLEDQTTSSNIIIPLVGGQDQRQRQIYLNDILRLLPTHEKNIFGISFEGFHSYGPSTENINLDSLKPLIEETRTKLNQHNNLLFTMPLIWRPDNVIRGIDLGLDLFSGAYVAHISDRAIILAFRYNKEMPSNTTGTDYLINSKEYASGKQPLLTGCQCYTCLNYSQAYVHHLVQTKELLGRTLITIHNLYHYHAFFYEIRKSLKANTWNEYRTMILDQYPAEQQK
jgi:queuine tRNA-ribosyltransferase subunit QTRTD1